jgi:galactokinase
MIGVISGDMPIGGLSSSAAVTLAYLLSLAWVNRLSLSRQQLVALARWAENSYVGVASGILDQSVILYSMANHLTVIDCRNGAVECLPGVNLNNAHSCAIMVVYSGMTRCLVATGYNERVKECQEAARRLLSAVGSDPGPDARLSQVEPDLFASHGHRLPDSLRRRSEHYFNEVQRVSKGVEAWQAGDMARFGELMSASGASSAEKYECGSPHLLTLYRALRDTPGVYGARFSGGGFGGSCIAMVDPAAVPAISRQVRDQYLRAHPEQAERFSIHICSSMDGARLLDVEV